MKKKIIIFSIIALISLILFLILAGILKNDINTPAKLDTSIRDFFYDIRGNKGGFLYWISRIITEFGNVYFIILLGVAIIIYAKLDNRAFSFILGALLMILLNYALKDIYQRERPIEALKWVIDSDASFPSGHATASSFTYMFLAYFIYDSDLKKVIKIIGYVFCSILFILVPTTRLVFGAHYFTDVIAGALNGIMVSSITIIFMLLLKHFKIFDEPLLSLLYDSIKNRKKDNEEEKSE